ncbi:T9SS type A sorting domain-containing protein [Taibaiella lutea]|uniref:T9SS type A sorting domain-containing protein n=1 Tax=Taibaiella lutea TaxID=2608001 RepID=A0A5M6CHR8_9BACT|nr:GEVED domain-containing protein [Taibaiella lutea]KAA5534536.1 T9SS type A sorting domain-containing protein [Taibaiella lutea]
MKNYYQKQKNYWRKLIPLIALPVATIFSALSAKAQTYCNPTYPSGCGSWGVYGTNSVIIGSFMASPASCSNGSVSTTVSLNAGVSTSVSIITHGWMSIGIAADFNNDGDFLDAGELLALPDYAASDPHTYPFTITVPPDIITGNYRLRIWSRSANGGGAGNGEVPCGAFGYGNYLDYTLAVTNTATCLPPSSAITIVPASVTAALSWTAATTSPQSYDWKIVANGGNPITDPGVTSGNVTGTTASASGLTSSTTYQLYVRSKCTSATDTSAWTLGTTFNTLCAGTPTGGTAATTVTPVCPTTSFTLSLTGNTTGPGISYQWQSSPAGAGTFTNISGATTSSYTGTQSSAKDYRCYLVCAGSGLSDTSALINVGQSPATSCYCVPTVTSSTSYYITSFSTTNGATNITNNGTAASGAYINYSATMSASAIQGNVVNFSLTGSSASETRGIYIDWNQDGDFDDAGENVYSSASTSSATVTGSFTVPFSAVTGNTRMRVRTSYYSYVMAPCGAIYYGETEDYAFNVIGVSGVCVFPVNFSVTGLSNTTATAHFSPPPAGNTPTNYIYELRTDGTAAGSGLTGLFSGGTSTDTTLYFTSLSQGTSYTLYARTFCSAGDTSSWVSYSFATTYDTLTSVSFAGFNADVIANGIGAASTSTTNDVDGASWALVANSFKAISTNAAPANSVPNNRIVKNGLRKYILNFYDNNNSIRMPNGSSGTARFLASKRANKVNIMGVSGSGASTTTTTIYFHDGTTQVATIGFPDWYGSGNNVASAVGRVNRTNNSLETGPYLHDTAISIQTAKRLIPIDSIKFSNAGQTMNVLAIGIVPNTNQPCPLPAAVGDTSNVTASAATISWTGNGTNTNYQVSYGALGTYADNGTIVSINGNTGANTYTINSGLSAATKYQAFIRTDCGSGSYSDWVGPINFLTLANNCSGTPATAALTATATSVCPNVAYTLNVSGISSNNGILLKWQSSPAGQNTWTTLSTVTPTIGVSNYSYGVATQTAGQDYRCIVNCTLTGDSSVSNVYTVSQNPPTQCYCTNTYTNTTSGYITNFTTTGGITNISNSSTNVPGGYNDFTAMQVSAVANTSFSFSATAFSTDHMGIFVDWNQDGDLSDPGEFVYTQNTTYASSFSGTIAIPSNAVPGPTRMRVRLAWSGNVTDPCAVMTYSETEDYTVNVIAQTACAGAPAPGNTISSASSLCVSGTTNLSLTNNYITYSGITYQWQSSTNGTTWDNMNAATGITTTSPTITQTTSFRCRLICSAGPDTAYSTPAQVVVNALPTVAISPAQGAFCTSGSATLTASGANTYAWTPTASLSAATGTSVVATPTAITTYTVTGTDVNGCINTGTATVGPIAAFTPTAVAANTCGANIPVTINVTPIATTDGTMEYSLTDTVGTIIGNWQAGTSFTVTPTVGGGYKYYVFARSTNCTSSVSDTGTVTFYAGFVANVTTTNASCANGDGSFVVGNVQGPGSGNSAAVWYSNDFSSSTLNTTYAELKGGASITGNRLLLTPNTTSQNGGFVIKNPTSINGHLDSVKFILTVPTSGADGLSWSFGDNLVYSTTAGLEQGIGDKLIISFDAYGTSGTSIAGIYLTYGQNNATLGGISTTTSSTMLGYSNNTSWRAASNKQVVVSISASNKLTLTVGGTVIFNAVQLPAAYTNADKSSWTQIIAARTGGVAEEHTIDNLGIYYNGLSYTYGSSPANSGTVPSTWQPSPVFSGLSGGDSLDIWVANPASPATCNKFLGTYGITSPVMASMLDSADPLCVGSEDGYVLLKVNAAGTYNVSYKKNGGATITQNALVSSNDGTNEYVAVILGQGAYTNFKVVNTVGSCVSNTIAGTTTLTAPAATAVPVSSTTSGAMNQPGAGTQYYTDASCDLIAAVTSANNLGTVTANVTVGTPAATPGGEPFVGRYVDVVPSQNANLPATLKLYFTTADFTAYNNAASVGTTSYPAILPDNSNLRIRAFHGLPSSGTTGPNGTYDATNSDILLPTSVVWNTNGFWEVTVYSPNGFSGFFANTTIGSPLNITIGKIAAHNEGAVNIVNWDTKTESANDRFIIERSSDARTFTAIGTMEGKGNAPSDYSFTDTKPFNSINYYRLILMNADGSRQYSNVVSAEVKNGNTFRLNVFPNPASTEVSVSVSDVIGKGQVELTDITGRVLVSQSISNSTTISLSLNGLADGIYLVKYHDDANVQTVKINKK